MFSKLTAKGRFWSWFAANAHKFSGALDSDSPLVNEIGIRFKRAYPKLAWEIGGWPGGDREFIVSAEGFFESVPSVQEAVKEAPNIPGWTVIAFRQVKDTQEIQFEGIRLTKDAIFFSATPIDDRLGIDLYIEGLSADNYAQFVVATFLLLDATIGEYAVMTRLAPGDFRPLVEGDGTQRPLSELPALLGL